MFTPKSPPEYEKIPLELVDPILTSTESITQISTDSIAPIQKNPPLILNQLNESQRISLLNQQISLRKDLLILRLKSHQFHFNSLFSLMKRRFVSN